MSLIKGATTFPLGDAAIVVQVGNTIDLQTNSRVRVLSSYLDQHPFPGMIEYTPAFTTVTVFYCPFQVMQAQANPQTQGKLPYELVQEMLERIVAALGEQVLSEPRTVEIPVCYGGEFGPDLAYVAERNGLSPDEVIEIHSGGEYLVYMIGFAPGFPYLGGMSERIAAPRKSSPRLAIPVGTVGIAGKQTGVYPIETPGGWQLIGRTPTALFRPQDNPPSLLRAGDIVRFRPISRAEYDAWKGESR